jgi:hypothetical protein
VFLLDGKPLSPDVAFTHAGIQYPANWLRLASPDERAAIGITEEPDAPVYDQQFYWAPGIPMDHAMLVERWTAATRSTCGTLILPTDWMVVREADNGTAMPAEVKAQRQAYRDKCEVKVAAIAATTTTDELAAYIRGPEYGQWEDVAPEPAAEMVRARNKDGTFVGDDPTTPEVDEAWVDGGAQ